MGRLMSNSLGMITVKTFLTQGDMWWVAGDLKITPTNIRSIGYGRERERERTKEEEEKREEVIPEMNVEDADGDDNRNRHQDHGEE